MTARRWSLEAFVGQLLADFFPRSLTVLDRDVNLSLVQLTLDYTRQFGLRELDAHDILRLQDDLVTIHTPEIRPTLRSSYLAAPAALRTLRAIRHRPAQWVNGDLPEILDENAGLLATDLDALDDAALMDVIEQAIVLRDRVFSSRDPHFLASFTLKLAGDVIIRHPQPRPDTAAQVPAGPGAGDRPTQRFRRDLIAVTEAWRAAATGARSREDVDAAVQEFLAVHGGRGQTFVPLVSDSVWDVAPDDFVLLLPTMADSALREPPAPTKAAARRPNAFERRLQEFEDARDWVVFGYEQTTRSIRNAALCAGRRLAARGAIADPSDVLHLRLDELRALLHGEAPVTQDTIERRRRAFEGDAGIKVAAPTAQQLRGVAAAPGSYSGRARVIRSTEDFHLLQPGDILVCSMTSPSWMPLLMIAGAVVTDLGGMLSHAAIVAREFGVPAVTGTRHATNWCVSDSQYRVDGNAGIVTPMLREA